MVDYLRIVFPLPLLGVPSLNCLNYRTKKRGYHPSDHSSILWFYASCLVAELIVLSYLHRSNFLR